MNKRITSLLLAVVMVLSAVWVAPLKVSAVSELVTSDACIELIKNEEGFVSKPYWDYSQYTVGYGTKCPDDKLDYYLEHGITEEEAIALLRSHLNGVEKRLNRDLIDRFGLTLTQNQFDALISFSYNCGTMWIYDESDNLRRVVIEGADENEMIYRFSRWCNAGGVIQTFLIRRRLCEANLYINGVYSSTVPDNYGYVMYDGNGGVSDPNIQGYNMELTAQIIPTPTYEGHTFDGWYTAKNGGTKVTVLDASVRNKRLYAHWIDGEGNNTNQEQKPEEGVTVTVTANEVNVRQGPGTGYPVMTQMNTGEQLIITETKADANYVWGKCAEGWICLRYTNYDTVIKESQDNENNGNKGSVMGTVKVSDCLRVRTGPGTAYSVAAYLGNGARVEVLEQKIVGYMVWGRIAAGWISLDYVELDPVAEKPDDTTPDDTTPDDTTPDDTTPDDTTPDDTTPDDTTPDDTTPDDTTPDDTTPDDTTPDDTTPDDTTPDNTKPDNSDSGKDEIKPTTWTGTVKVNDALLIRSGPSTSCSVVGYLTNGKKVKITEQTTSGSMTWGKISNGWISMNYVVLDKAETNTTPGTPATQTGTVKVSDYLRIRTGPSTSYAISGYLKNNEKVTILETKVVNGVTWGKISKGWISLDYVKLDTAGGNTAPQVTTKTVTADCLLIRSAAGTSNAIVGYLYRGAKVQILETKVVSGMTWGKISKGWISLDYVK